MRIGHDCKMIAEKTNVVQLLTACVVTEEFKVRKTDDRLVLNTEHIDLYSYIRR